MKLEEKSLNNHQLLTYSVLLPTTLTTVPSDLDSHINRDEWNKKKQCEMLTIISRNRSYKAVKKITYRINYNSFKKITKTNKVRIWYHEGKESDILCSKWFYWCYQLHQVQIKLNFGTSVSNTPLNNKSLERPSGACKEQMCSSNETSINWLIGCWCSRMCATSRPPTTRRWLRSLDVPYERADDELISSI